ncbi:MAG TPA: hypothetical protein VG838_09860 [Opitutaceae bacterium]|nr:hypothetical protein [Opitutaceae bacterium]
MKHLRLSFLLVGVALALTSFASAAPVEVTFQGQGAVSRKWTLAELNPDLPSDWTPYNFLVLEFRASSPQRFELELHTPGKVISKRLHPFQNALVRAAIPLKYFSAAATGGSDLASLTNKLGGSYFMSIEFGGYGPIDHVEAFGVTMRDPVGAPKLELRSVSLAKESPGDEVIEPKKLVDEFGQWIPADWPGKAQTLDDLKKAWAEESAGLGRNPLPDRDRFGGFTATQAKATGFFRVEQIDGKWWFIDPEGHYFFSNGANGISTASATRVTGREAIFTALPPADLNQGFGGRGGGGGGGGVNASFYTWNLVRRYGSGETWRQQWADTTARRMADWGLNTFYGGDQNLMKAEPRRPYVVTIREWQSGGQAWLGLPDVYADDFETKVDAIAARSCEPYKDDPYLLGYFIGNEPSWPTRESALADMILAAPTTAINRELKKWLADKGDTADTRKAFALQAFERYLTVIIAAVKKHDPNHLNLGIRFGGSPPPEVIHMGRLFDVYSHNMYSATPDPARVQRYYDLVHRPILIGEFHNGTPGRGMSPGLVQASSQEEKGFLYRCYVENAAANPALVGAHWFQFIDQPNTGRNDGENYNIGMVDVTDRPYPDMVAAMRLAHQNVLAIRLGKQAPVQRRDGAEAQDFKAAPSGPAAVPASKP